MPGSGLQLKDVQESRRNELDHFTMMLPRFKSQDELLKYLESQNLHGIDSEFSGATKALVNAFDAKGVHVNRWWVMTPFDWRCPSCRRKKHQIVRLNRHGFLTGQLHEHHDHMKDRVKKRFAEISVSRKTIVADELAERFAIRTAYGLSAYDNTVICSDCNHADSSAKAAANTHADFSYSPAEILAFVRPRDNTAPHEIDEAVATRIWMEGRDLFQLRLNMVDQVAELASKNCHWYQPSEITSARTERIAEWWFRRYGLDELSHASGEDPEKYLYNPVVFSGELSSWRMKNIKPNKLIPTERDIQHLVATRGSFWKKVGDDWRCPCCGRSKGDCVRPSKKNPWVFEIKNKLLFSSEEPRHRFFEHICDDCANTANHLGREAAGALSQTLEYPSSLVALSELRSIVISRPHSPHAVDNTEVDALLPQLVDRLYGICDEAESMMDNDAYEEDEH